jgi:hypothetical protein
MSCTLSGNTLSSTTAININSNSNGANPDNVISLCSGNSQGNGDTTIRINSVNGGQRGGGSSQYATIFTSTDGDFGSILNISAVKKLILNTTDIDGTILQYDTNTYGKISNDNGLHIQSLSTNGIVIDSTNEIFFYGNNLHLQPVGGGAEYGEIYHGTSGGNITDLNIECKVGDLILKSNTGVYISNGIFTGQFNPTITYLNLYNNARITIQTGITVYFDNQGVYMFYISEIGNNYRYNITMVSVYSINTTCYNTITDTNYPYFIGRNNERSIIFNASNNSDYNIFISSIGPF